MTVTDAAGTITRQFDALNRITKLTDTSGNVIQYAYDAVSNLSALTYPDGKIVTYAYDAANRLTTVTDWANRITQYTYDANGKLIKTERPDGSVLTLTYDSASRLTSAADNDSSGKIIVCYSYAYDADGNITSGTSLQQNATMTYDIKDKLSVYNGQNTTFDLDGNMTDCVLGGNALNFSFDSGNRLLKAGSTEYTYDAIDNRISSTTGDQKTQYAYDNVMGNLSRLLIRTDPNGNNTYYVYGIGLIGHDDANGYIVYHYDYRGSTVALTNVQGVVTDNYTYWAYGELLTHIGTSNMPFLYNGRDGVLTEANGLYYMRARYYAPEIKRFINADSEKGSINKSKTINLYVYASGDPVKMVDPLGTSSDNWWNSTYECPFTWPSSSEILTDIGNDTLGGSIGLSKELLGGQTKNVNWFVDESGYIRGLPGNGLEVAKFPKIVGVLGKASDVITCVGGGFDIANTWTANSGNTNGQRVEKTGIQLAGIGTIAAGGAVGTALIVGTDNAWNPVGWIILGGALIVATPFTVNEAQNLAYSQLGIK